MARAMKDSGIEWIGEIPEGWEIRRLRFLCSITTGNQDTQDNDPSGEYPFYVRSPVVERSNQFSFEGDAILMAGDGVGAGKIFHYVSGKYGCHQRVYSLQKIHWINRRLLYYYLRNRFYISIETANSKSTVDSVRLPMLQDFPVMLPPNEEQELIASFLDVECARIDAVINQTRASIEEYKKLKQAVITQAVTKGIRPGRKMKGSGVEWIGEIPEEWDLIPFRHVLKERAEKNIPVKSTERLSLSIDLGVTLYSEKTTNLDRFKDDFEQYKIAHAGDLVMNSMNMIVGATGVSDYYGCVSPAYYTFYDDTPDHVTAKYCEYIFRSKTMLRVLYSLGKGIYAIVRGDDRVNTCRLKVSREDLRQIEIPLPSTEEQREIVKYLSEKTQEIDDLIKQKNVIISELESYKKSLIFEYVTGKKEVI